MSSMGAKPEVSSNAGNLIEVNCGFTSPRVKSGVPHCGQKLRVVTRPLLPCTSKVFKAPDTSSSALATTTPDAKGAPLERWQSSQWQFNMAIGAPAIRNRTAPQAHFPVGEFIRALSRAQGLEVRFHPSRHQGA